VHRSDRKAHRPDPGGGPGALTEEFGPLLRHAGEEYFLVTSGSVEVHTEFYAPEILHEGDGIYIDSTMGHAYLNAGEQPAKGVCLCTSEVADLYDQLRRITARDGERDEDLPIP